MPKIEIYAYTMTHDTGFAPAEYKNMLSLACCKPRLRDKIGRIWEEDSNIFVIGLCGKQLAERHPEKSKGEAYFPVYIAKINLKPVAVEEYYSNEEFEKRPDARQYRFDGENWFVFRDNPHHEEYKSFPKKWIPYDHDSVMKDKDLRYIWGTTINRSNSVLLSTQFVCPRSPDNLPEIMKEIGDERRKVWRSDLVPIKCAKDREDEFLKCFDSLMKSTNKKTTPIDGFFIESKCGGVQK